MKRISEIMRDIITRHTFFLVYCCICVALFNGLYADSGWRYMPLTFLYFIVFVIAYVLASWFIHRRFSGISLPVKWRLPVAHYNIVFHILFWSIFGFVIIHFLYLQKIPIITAWLSTDYYEIVDIRKDITRSAISIIRYSSSFMIKAIIPFSLLSFLIRRKKYYYWALLLGGSFYAIALMQKSFIITILSPVIIYAFLNRKWLYCLKYIFIVLISLYTQLYVANPALRNVEVPQEVRDIQNRISKFNRELKRDESFMYAIYNRIMYIPGKMVSDWYKHVPADKPFLEGCGYRFIAPLKGCEFKNYAQDLYPEIYPEYAAIGVHGNVNVSSFMYEYANFGWLGLIISGILLACLLCLIELIFAGDFKIKICLITFYILMLSSSALTTLLLSGGLGIMVVLYMFMKGVLVSNE